MLETCQDDKQKLQGKVGLAELTKVELQKKVTKLENTLTTVKNTFVDEIDILRGDQEQRIQVCEQEKDSIRKELGAKINVLTTDLNISKTVTGNLEKKVADTETKWERMMDEIRVR